MLRRLIPLMLLVPLLLGSACSGRGGSDGRLQIVATTAILGDFARQVAGPDATVSVIIPVGVDVHSFEPAPSVARAVSKADVLVLNGYHLEESVLNVVAQNKAKDATVVIAAAGLAARAPVEEHEEDEEKPKGLDALATDEGDPHLWLSVAGARKYVENIRDGLIAADAAHAEGYRSRAATYLDTLSALDSEIKAIVQQIPQARRQLVVFHDAYGAFAEAYGFTLTAAVLPGGANQQVSAQKVVEVVATVKRAGVPAIYSEPEFDATVLAAIGKETGARVLVLHSIYSGSITDYPSMMRANAAALVDGLAR